MYSIVVKAARTCINKARLAIIVAITILSMGMLAACESALIGMLNFAEVTKLEVKNDKLYIADLLNSKTFGQMQRVIADNQQVNTLVFTAMEGSIDDDTTFKMGRWIRKQGLNTHLTAQSVIASGAVDLYLSGAVRTMERGAQLGVHSWSDGSKEAADFPRDSREHQLNKTYIVDMGVPEEFYWFTIYKASADAIHWMSEAEITKHKLTTTPISNNNTAPAIPFVNYEQMRTAILQD